MQIRRLITLLQKEIKKNPSVAYMPIAVYPKAFKSEHYTVMGIKENDIGVIFMPWSSDGDCAVNDRAVFVLGSDRLSCDIKKMR